MSAIARFSPSSTSIIPFANFLNTCSTIHIHELYKCCTSTALLKHTQKPVIFTEFPTFTVGTLVPIRWLALPGADTFHNYDQTRTCNIYSTSLASTKMPIQDLPVELLRPILKDFRMEDHLSLLLSCRSIYHLIQPLIYENLDFSSINANPNPLFYENLNISWNNGNPNRPRKTLLLRTLLHRPELGEYVKHLRLRGMELWIGSPLNQTDLEELRRRVYELGPLKNYDCLGSFAESNRGQQSMTTLLLSYCCNLESLDLQHRV